jgi:hypothetical protein
VLRLRTEEHRKRIGKMEIPGSRGSARNPG